MALSKDKLNEGDWYYEDGTVLAVIERQLVVVGDHQVVLQDKKGNMSVKSTDFFLEYATPMENKKKK